jgi:hypothetical protein
VLPHSSRWRGWLAECEDQPHLIEGLHQVSTRLGGVTQRWRFDRMARPVRISPIGAIVRLVRGEVEILDRHPGQGRRRLRHAG